MRWTLCVGYVHDLYAPTHKPVQKNYERILFNINLLCNHVCIKLLACMVQWIFNMIQNSYSCKIEGIGVPIIDYKELEELNIVQW